MQQDWTVLLLGGSSAMGKSYLTRQLSVHYQIPLLEVDDIRIAIQQIADREKYPELFYFLDHPDYLQANTSLALVSKLVNVAKAVWPALNELISKHIACHEPVIFEGDGILPELLAKRDLKQIKALFLVDTKEHLYATDVQRHRGNYTGEGIDKQAEFSFQYGLELQRQSTSYGFPVINTWPRETLYARVLAELEK